MTAGSSKAFRVSAAIATAVIFSSAAACSRHPAPAPSEDPEARRALAAQFLNLSGASERRRTAIVNAAPKTGEDTPHAKEFWRRLSQEEISICADVFTTEELRGMVDFYQSDAGKAFCSKQPELAKRLGEAQSEQMLNFDLGK